jgi:phosphoserine phosphatase
VLLSLGAAGVRGSERRCHIRLVVFDLDGVLVPIKSSWEHVHKALGTTEESKYNYELFRRGLIGYWEWMYMDTLVWLEAKPGLTRWDLEEIFRNVEPTPEAWESVKLLREAGMELALISGGVDVLVSKIASLLGIKHWLSPALSFDPWGRLIPGGEPRVEADRKDKAVLSLARRLSYTMRQVAFIGDSYWDLRGMREACLAIAVNTDDPRVIGEADYQARDLLDAAYFILEHTKTWKHK